MTTAVYANRYVPKRLAKSSLYYDILDMLNDFSISASTSIKDIVDSKEEIMEKISGAKKACKTKTLHKTEELLNTLYELGVSAKESVKNGYVKAESKTKELIKKLNNQRYEFSKANSGIFYQPKRAAKRRGFVEVIKSVSEKVISSVQKMFHSATNTFSNVINNRKNLSDNNTNNKTSFVSVVKRGKRVNPAIKVVKSVAYQPKRVAKRKGLFSTIKDAGKALVSKITTFKNEKLQQRKGKYFSTTATAPKRERNYQAKRYNPSLSFNLGNIGESIVDSAKNIIKPIEARRACTDGELALATAGVGARVISDIRNPYQGKRVKKVDVLENITDNVKATASKIVSSPVGCTACVAVALAAVLAVNGISKADGKNQLMEMANIPEVALSYSTDVSTLRVPLVSSQSFVLQNDLLTSGLVAFDTINDVQNDTDIKKVDITDTAGEKDAETETSTVTEAQGDEQINKVSEEVADGTDVKAEDAVIVNPVPASTPTDNSTHIVGKEETVYDNSAENVNIYFNPADFYVCPEGVSLDALLNIYGITYDQFRVVAKIILCEAYAEGNGYNEVYAVTTTLLNRISCSRWIRSHGSNIYQQAIAPSQYVVYETGSYLKYDNKGINIENVNGYRAIIDCLYNYAINPENRMHNYCSFRSSATTSYSNNRVTARGNRYGGLMDASEVVYPYFIYSEAADEFRNQALFGSQTQASEEIIYEDRAVDEVEEYSDDAIVIEGEGELSAFDQTYIEGGELTEGETTYSSDVVTLSLGLR